MKKLARLVAITLAILHFFALSAFADESSKLHDTLKKLIESVLEDYSSYLVMGNDSGYYICISHDYAFDAAGNVMLGLASYDVWESFVASTLSFADSLQNLIEIAGVENPNLLFIVIDDYGLDMPLLIICNGSVIYDFVDAP